MVQSHCHKNALIFFVGFLIRVSGLPKVFDHSRVEPCKALQKIAKDSSPPACILLRIY